MNHPDPITLIQNLAARYAGSGPEPSPCSERIPVEHYTNPAHASTEYEKLFLRYPLVVAHESQIPNSGDAIVYDWLGLPLVTLRDTNGEIATFMNVCRHRGMRLLQDEGQTCVRSLVCPYHHWTYGLDGMLRNVPHMETFTELDTSTLNLVRLPTAVRHGLIWMQATPNEPMDLDSYLGGLGRDLDIFELDSLNFCAQSVRTVNCNWKLIQDAFLDGYHVTRLHKNTVGKFFQDALAESDAIGLHIRSAVARKEISETADLAADGLDLRRHATFSYTIFPNAILIFHPEYTSVISLFPQGPDKTVFAHTMLTPAPPESPEQHDHFQRSFELIDRGVFEAEDIFVGVGAQRGMESGANKTLLFGGLEESAIRFHATIARELGG